MRRTITRWDSVISNNAEIKPISFIKLFKIETPQQRVLAYQRMMNDTNFTVVFASALEHKVKIIFYRLGNVFGKKIQIGTVDSLMTKTQFSTKLDYAENVDGFVNAGSFLYEVVYSYENKFISVPVICLKAGWVYDSGILSSTHFY